VAKTRNKLPSFCPGDLVQGVPSPGSGDDWLCGPTTGPCLVLRTHRTVLRSGWEGQEVWVLEEGHEKKYLSDELEWVDPVGGPRW
jgi:hypothetical protein